ncbi:hypothetical protein M501DRAFT_1015891 [Patellaria atrata CBS 101060]|uniref:Uncharacterized protein n=1 Tax=Patellaria atrata CBS 101060 TaxID=1346257 RepID=A0A9P4VNJ3_9PEZI|nr:hypothetical protein M501DRAFT_1015891 [Patellaria atrata CBS 101060]
MDKTPKFSVTSIPLASGSRTVKSASSSPGSTTQSTFSTILRTTTIKSSVVTSSGKSRPITSSGPVTPSRSATSSRPVTSSRPITSSVKPRPTHKGGERARIDCEPINGQDKNCNCKFVDNTIEWVDKKTNGKCPRYYAEHTGVSGGYTIKEETDKGRD